MNSRSDSIEKDYLNCLGVPIWLARRPLQYARPSSLVEAKTSLGGQLNTASTPAKEVSKEVSKPLKLPAKKSNLKTLPELDASAVKSLDTPTKASSRRVDRVQVDRLQLVAAAIGHGYSIAAELPLGQVGLDKSQAHLLENLIKAIQKLAQVANQPVEFQFFCWPPQTGLGQGINPNEMAQGAIKGFLHKVAAKQQCTWIILGKTLSEKCFNERFESNFHTIQRSDQQFLLVGPSVTRLQANKALKVQLWQQIQEILSHLAQ